MRVIVKPIPSDPKKTRGTQEKKIIAAVTSTPRSSTELAKVVGVTSSAAYRICRKLQEAGLLESTLEAGARLLFCVDDHEVVTHDNYDRCTSEHEIRSFPGKKRVWHAA